jgi:hypothetical protein
MYFFLNLKQLSCLLMGWIRYKTASECKVKKVISRLVYLNFGGLGINSK